MKKIAFLFCFLPFLSGAQTIFAYTDFNNFFKVFRDGYFMQIEHNPVSDVQIGDEMIAYMNVQKDFKIYDGKTAQMITNQIVQYKMSDHILAWNIGPIINYRVNGKSHTVTSFGGEYAVTDSLLVYQDTRYNTVNAIYNDKTYQLYQTTGDLYMPDAIGDNVIMFRDNGNLYKAFWQGKIYEMGVWSGNQGYQFSAGTDIIAFNDPATRTFAVFEKGEFMDVESVYVNKYEAGRGFIVYEDVQGNLKYYSNRDKEELSSFYQGWDVKDDVAMWNESNMTYAYIFDKKHMVCNYIPKDYELKNDVIAFRSNMGGVAGFINGELKEISNLPDLEYTINKHSVMVRQKNRSVMVLFKGQVYRD